MKILPFTFIILVIFNAILFSEDRRTDKSSLVIMTLNAEFLWDGIEPEEGQVNFDWKNSETEASEHMRNIADLIIMHNPDIVNLVEVENIDAINKLNDDFLNGFGYKAYLVNGRDTYTGQDVAVLSRIDPEDGALYRSDNTGQSGNIYKSVSKNYYARFSVNDKKIAMIGLHFLSGPLRQDRRFQREAQADAIRQIASDLYNSGYSLIILGDFNDFDGSSDCLDHIDSTPCSNVLKILKDLDPGTADDDLINVAKYLPKGIRYTAFYDKNDNGEVNYPEELTSIDHILVSNTLSEYVHSVDIPHNQDPRLVSDHYPILVSLQFGDGTPTAMRIIRVLPNPSGDEDQDEEVTIKNFSDQSINLAGWKLKDRANTYWNLNDQGQLAPNSAKTIKRNGKPMALNNNGDTIELLDSQGTLVDRITYPRAAEDEVIEFSN